MQARLVLRLAQQQLECVLGWCALYRSSLWQNVPPTLARNQAVREIQVLQGRLTKVKEQGQPEIILVLTEEELSTLQQLCCRMTHWYAEAPISEQRTRYLSVLTVLRVLIEHAHDITPLCCI